MPKAKNEAEAGTVSVNVEDFQRTRDSVIVALATLQSSVQDLSRAYINHANTVLGGGSAGLLNIGLASTLLDTGLVGPQVRAQSPPAQAETADGKKKRKRAPHDPNAPKRALTPYFLYMQSARAQIAEELGDNAKPKEVADEGTRRWGAMAEEDKAVWNQIYAKNLAIYREKMKAYKAGLPVPSDEDAARLVDIGAIKIPDVTAAGAAAGADSDESSPEPVKAPEPKANKRRKTADKVSTPAKDTPSKKSPEKKKSDKKAAPAAASAAPAKAAADAGKKKKASKK